MTQEPFARIAVIGLGMATKPHLEGLDELRGRVEVSGVFNRTRAKAETVAAKFGWPIFESIEAIAADPDTDCVLIATPPNQRAELVAKMAAAGNVYSGASAHPFRQHAPTYSGVSAHL
jgi:UDP-N-acetyl-2-amino-2-deoxyglucuronate dehydrogenase